VLADGTVLKGLRKYIKNNTGTDLKQCSSALKVRLAWSRAPPCGFSRRWPNSRWRCALPSFDAVRALLGLVRKRLGGSPTA
jgi:hypothetical protein